MVKKRPPVILVIAILSLIGGSLGLLGSICGGAMQLAGGNKMFAGGGGQQDQEQQKLQEDIDKAIEKGPGGKLVRYGEMGMDLVLSLLMVIGGIGLLSMQSWARTLTIVYAILSIVNHIFSLIYALAFTIPATNEVIQEFTAKDQQAAQFVSFMRVILIGGAILGFLFIAYPIFVLIAMLRRSIAVAFRGEDTERMQEPESEDYYDPRPDDRESDYRFRPDDR